MSKSNSKKTTTPTAKNAAGGSAVKSSKPTAVAQNAPKSKDSIEDEKDEQTVKQTPGSATGEVTSPIDELTGGNENPSGKFDDDPPVELLQQFIEPKIVHTFGITDKTVIVVAADGVASDILLRAWSRAAAPADIRIVSPGDTLAATLESIVADDLIPDEFVLVPGICFPTRKVTLADLTLYRKRVLFKGEIENDTRLPMYLTKENILKALETANADPTQTDEVFIGQYNAVAHAGEIPTAVSLHFGNAVCYAAGENICTAHLVDALQLKKFICLTADAFPVAKRYLEEYAKR